MGCVSREVEEGGGVEGQTPGLTGPPSAAAGLAVLKVGSPDSLNRLVMSNAQLIFKRLGEGQIRLSLWQGLLLL